MRGSSDGWPRHITNYRKTSPYDPTVGNTVRAYEGSDGQGSGKEDTIREDIPSKQHSCATREFWSKELYQDKVTNFLPDSARVRMVIKLARVTCVWG